MNRSIKFRAWTDNLKDKGEMYYQEVSPEYHLWFSPAGYGLMNPSLKIMQFTGLLDRDEKDIYEGDIISFAGLIQKYEIIYKDSAFITNPYQINLSIDGCKAFAQVIGNIYENPELLKNESRMA